MFITGSCPEWFWLIPFLGMVLMIGLMVFMCSKGMRSSVTGMCGCGRTNRQCSQERIENDKTRLTDSNKE